MCWLCELSRSRMRARARATIIPAVFSGSVASGIAVPRAHCFHEIRSRKERKLCPSAPLPAAEMLYFLRLGRCFLSRISVALLHPLSLLYPFRPYMFSFSFCSFLLLFFFRTTFFSPTRSNAVESRRGSRCLVRTDDDNLEAGALPVEAKRKP